MERFDRRVVEPTPGQRRYARADRGFGPGGGPSEDSVMDRNRRATRAGRWIAMLIAVCLPLAPAAVSAAHLDPVMDQGQLVDRITSGQAPPLIDVRTPGEYRAGHIPGAINIPLQDFAQRLAELSAYRDREAVLYCELGVRASYGVRWLESLGFEELRLVDGDMVAWRKAGLPTER